MVRGTGRVGAGPAHEMSQLAGPGAVRRGARAARWGLVLAGALLTAGCQTTAPPQVPTVRRTRLMVARSGNQARLQWESDARVYYTVLFSDTPQVADSWHPLPEASNLSGTGDTMALEVAVPPQAAARRFDLVATERPVTSVRDLRRRRTSGP